MQLTENNVGSVMFTITSNSYDGEIVEKINEENPFEFVVGAGSMLESLENKLKGLKKDDEFKFILNKEDAYGSYLEDMIIEVEKQYIIDQLEDPELISEELQLDNYLPMNDDEGNSLMGKIIEIGDDLIKLDFNHPLAEMNLCFSGKILDVRKATAQEIEEGVVFNPTKWEDATEDEIVGCYN